MAGFQRTIKKSVSVAGVGLHTGVECTATFKPADVNTGILFLRTDIDGSRPIPATIDHVVDISRGTTLGLDDIQIHTIEHLLAAVSGLGIDNLLVELTAKEPPILDGSAKPFVDALYEAGIEEQNANKEILVIDQPVSYADPANDIDMHVLPSDTFRITFTMDYRHLSRLGTQYMSVYSMEEDFVERIAPARTFCLLSEVKALLDRGLAKGGSLENAVVFVDKTLPPDEITKLRKAFSFEGELEPGEDGLLKGQTLRFENEAVRHKVADLIGDLALLGMPIRGHVIATRSGHASNVEFVRRLQKIYAKRISQKKAHVEAAKAKFDIAAIVDILPHRYPMLLIDRILDVEPGKRVRALKNITTNEPYFQGHFPGQPVMPGVLILEAMAQAGGFLLLNTVPNPETKLIYLSAIDKTRFRRAVVPGDQVILEIEVLKLRMFTCKLGCKAYVDGKVATEAELMATVVDREE